MDAELIARCPACGELRDVETQTRLRATEARWIVAWTARGAGWTFGLSRDGMRRLAEQNNPRWFWACDACLERGRAIPADVTQQKLAMGTPFAAYVDRPFVCADCSAPACFSASEQRHWFEELRFLLWVYPKQCVPCRAERRRRAKVNTELADALHGLDEKDPAQLEAVARLYDELGRTAKATELRSRARNRRRT